MGGETHRLYSIPNFCESVIGSRLFIDFPGVGMLRVGVKLLFEPCIRSSIARFARNPDDASGITQLRCTQPGAPLRLGARSCYVQCFRKLA